MDEGHLVKIFESEEIYRKYADEIIYTTSGPDREVFNAEFDEDRMVWQITTQHRGPNLFGKRLRCYWESYTWDARTGEVLSSWRVDWILWGAWAVMAVVAGFLLIRYRRRRKWIAQATGH